MNLIYLKCDKCKRYFFAPPLFKGTPGSTFRIASNPLNIIYTCPNGHEVNYVMNAGEYISNDFGIFELLNQLPIVRDNNLLKKVIDEGRAVNLLRKSEIQGFAFKLFSINDRFYDIFNSFKGISLLAFILIILSALTFFYYKNEFLKKSKLDNINIDKINYIK
ncbi:hypothetical protein I6I97_17520 [Sphingobacterium multivorum]|uniref:hypothetical protein n=1 Tax=Sphingobacterium multivorum TaxID=28454 RepID=UPI00191A9C43|nr:hypothetical protein [Sphingobacterium multivorum]QQT61000.1 hypothetical protein I6I97_17520 [Sphingobacterium multivorum]